MGVLKADELGVQFTLTPDLAGRPIDLRLNGRRVWSTYAPDKARRGLVRVEWPEQLRPYLVGRGRLSITSPLDGDVIAMSEVRLGDWDGEITIANDRGDDLVLNKWGHLVRSAGEEAVKRALVADAKQLVGRMQELGYIVFVTGGSLLGAVRSNDVLLHDDDFDLAVYFDESSPADLALRCYRMCRELREAGYEVFRHSTAHVQLLFRDETRELLHYIDIFTGFHRDGVYNQPFAMRGELTEAELFPLTTIEIAGETFPSVAEPAAWLALCYGPDWRIPDPAFRFDTPSATRRRFENWFGVFDQFRTFWDDRFAAGVVSPSSGIDRRRLLERLPSPSRVLDLGCGEGQSSRALAAAGHGVTAVDFSTEALRNASRHDTSGIEYRRCNLVERREVLDLVADELLAADGEPVHVFLSDVLHSIGIRARANVFLLIRQLARRGGWALASFATDESSRLRHEHPDTWHLPLSWLEREIAPFGLVCDLVAMERRGYPAEEREVATVVLRLAREADRLESGAE